MIRAGRFYIPHQSRSDIFRLYPFADFHLHNRACDKPKLHADLQRAAADPFGLVTGVGDYADYVGYRDKRFDPDALDPELLKISDLARLGKKQTEDVRDLFAPLKDKLVGLGFGNHEWKIQNMTQQRDLHVWLCTELETRNLGYCALYDLIFVRLSGCNLPPLPYHETSETGQRLRQAKGVEKWALRVFQHHGAGFAQTRGGKMNRLERFMHQHRANLYIASHCHDKMGDQISELGADRACAKPVSFNKVGVITGGYLLSYAEGAPGYAEPKGYAPTPLGVTVITITPERKRVEVSIGGSVSATETYDVSEEDW